MILVYNCKMELNKYNLSIKVDHLINYSDTGVAFVHVPKTGGTYLSIPILPKKNRAKQSSLPGDMHMPVSEIEKMTNNSVPLFTLMRDPYDRVCSEYFFTINRAKELTILNKWKGDDLTKIEFLAKNIAIRTKNKKVYEKIYNIYKNNMSVEDYLEWSIENPTYPHYYDTKMPCDFDLVGLTEEIEKSRQLLKIIYQTSSGGGDSNKNLAKNIKEPYKTLYSRSQFEAKNLIEYDFYQQAKEKFYKFCKKYL